MSGSTLQGKVVVITGGARGIGYATARRLHQEGMKVAVGDIDETRVLEAGEELGIDTVGRLDVTDTTSFRTFYDMVTNTLGTPDALINNAGVMPIGPTVAESDTVAHRMIDINFHGVVNGTKLALESMLPRRYGHIINIASMAGEASVPGLATYCGSKAAVIAFTDAVRLEHRTSGVKVSLVLPTFTNTDLVAGTRGPKGFRNAEPEQIAEAITELLTHPRPRAYVTKSMGRLLKMQRLMPAALAEGVARRLGSEQMFLHGVDKQARSDYEARAAKS